MPLRINIDVSDAVEHLRTVDGNLSRAARRAVSRAASQVEARIRPTMLQVYDTAVASTGGDFPSVYASHLRQGIQQLQIQVTPRDDDLLILIDDIEDLGDYSDLMEAAHYHAILNVGSKDFSVSNPPLSPIGTDAGDLYGPNKPSGEDRREEFFEAMVAGADFTVQFGNGTNTPSWTGVVSTAGMLEETLNARIGVWGNRYPEWIILDEGSPAGIIVEPTHFVELTRFAIEDMAIEIVEQIAIITFNEAVTDDPIRDGGRTGNYETTFDPRIGQRGGFRGPGGRFTKRPTGQF